MKNGAHPSCAMYLMALGWPQIKMVLNKMVSQFNIRGPIQCKMQNSITLFYPLWTNMFGDVLEPQGYLGSKNFGNKSN